MSDGPVSGVLDPYIENPEAASSDGPVSGVLDPYIENPEAASSDGPVRAGQDSPGCKPRVAEFRE